jgi:peroxiredoxin
MKSFWSLCRTAGVVSLAVALSNSAMAQDKPAPGKDDKKPAAKEDKFGQDAKDAKAAKPEEKKTDTAAGATVGADAPAFDLKGTDGKTYKLADLKDKTVVLEWINRECPVCVKQAPQMKETAAALQKKGVVWLAIDSTSFHKLEDNTAHVKKDGLPYPILDDSAGTVGRAYGAKATPTMFVISKGKVVYTGSLIPEKGGSNNFVTEAVEAVLANKPVAQPETKAYGCSVKYAKKEQ